MIRFLPASLICFLVRYQRYCIYFFAVVLWNLALTEPAMAAQGGTIFRAFACALLEKVLQEDFGAAVTAVTGFLAIVAAAAGSFRGAWACVFVSVGCFVYPGLVGVFFPDLECAGVGLEAPNGQ